MGEGAGGRAGITFGGGFVDDRTEDSSVTKNEWIREEDEKHGWEADSDGCYPDGCVILWR